MNFQSDKKHLSIIMKNILLLFCLACFVIPIGNISAANSISGKKGHPLKAIQRGSPAEVEAFARQENAKSTRITLPERHLPAQAEIVRIKEQKSTSGNVLGYVSFGLGLASITFGILCFLAFPLAFFTIPMGIAAIILNSISKKKEPKSPQFGKIGKITGILGIIFSVLGVALWVVLFSLLWT